MTTPPPPSPINSGNSPFIAFEDEGDVERPNLHYKAEESKVRGKKERHSSSLYLCLKEGQREGWTATATLLLSLSVAVYLGIHTFKPHPTD